MDVKSERSSRGPGVRIRISFVWAILLEEHANQLISRDRNNQKNGANHANHEHPAQNMSHNPDNKVEHSTPLNTFGGILPLLSGRIIRKFYDFFMRFLVS